MIKVPSITLSQRSEDFMFAINWVAVKELKLRYYIGETLLSTIYTYSGNLI